MKITFRWPHDQDEYLTPATLAGLEGQPTKVLTQDDGGEDVIWDAVVVNAVRVEDGPVHGVLVQLELLDGVVQ